MAITVSNRVAVYEMSAQEGGHDHWPESLQTEQRLRRLRRSMQYLISFALTAAPESGVPGLCRYTDRRSTVDAFCPMLRLRAEALLQRSMS